MHDLDPVEALGLHLATGDLPEGVPAGHPGVARPRVGAGVDRLMASGPGDRVEPSDTHRASLALTDRGVSLRQEIETETDRAAVYAYEALSRTGAPTCERWSARSVGPWCDAAGFGF